MNIGRTHRALLSRPLPGDEPGGLAVRQGQFHNVVIGADRVVCLPRSRAAAARLPERAAAALYAIRDGDEEEPAEGLAGYR